MNESGQDLAEYGLLMGFIAVLLLVAVTVLGQNLHEWMDALALAIRAWGG